MKKFLILPLLALAGPVTAQHSELIGRAGVGLMQFGGANAVGTSQVNYGGYGGGYTNTPYGSRLGTGFAIGFRVQHVGQRQGVLAFDLGYDWLRSRTAIDYINFYDPLNGPQSANGTTHLQTQNVTGFLGLGRRFQGNIITIDALLGPELAYVFNFHEKGNGTYDGGSDWATDVRNRAPNRFDFRLRADATAWCRRLGFNASYSYGLLNYQSGLIGASPEVYSRTLRVGLAYRLL
ncbi:MAG: hypothetical protein JWR44_2011 [Hymenobacter sp.]|jgi:hypothetical protein|nr:hypothetical protein [Hymenobacter sp.]